MQGASDYVFHKLLHSAFPLSGRGGTDRVRVLNEIDSYKLLLALPGSIKELSHLQAAPLQRSVGLFG
jgi:hypothetical protein